MFKTLAVSRFTWNCSWTAWIRYRRFLTSAVNTQKYDFCWFIATALLARRRWCVMMKMRSSMSKLNRSHYLVEFQTWSSNGEIFDKNRWHWLRGAMGPALPPQPIFCRLSSFFVSSTLFPNLSCCQVCDLLITDKLSSMFPLQILQRNSLQNFPS